MTPERRHQLRILQAQAGDRAALGALLADLQASLHAYLRGLVGRRDHDRRTRNAAILFALVEALVLVTILALR